MPRFLHLADIHLGFDRYDSPQRTQDFFRAFYDAIETYAIGGKVDFVLLAGDIFEHRQIKPAVLNQAQMCLKVLNDAGIPVLAIEGNHDNRPFGSKTSWLRYLADYGLLILLEPDTSHQGEVIYQPWNEEEKRGGYIDLDCGVRVLGSCWYGASAPQAIPQLADAIKTLPPPPPHTVMMFHHGLEGQIGRYSGALRYGELLPLKQAGVDYLALGHIHKHYTVENWIYNPGSVEANNVEESTYERGVYLVNLTTEGIDAQLKQDYYQRPILRLCITAKGKETTEEIEAEAIAVVDKAMNSFFTTRGNTPPSDQPILELRIEGKVGFNRGDLDVRRLQQQLKEASNALIFLLKFEASPVTYRTSLSHQSSQSDIEQEIFSDIIAANVNFQNQGQMVSQGLSDLKTRCVDGQSEEELYLFIDQLLQASPSE
ncbi:MAG: exonuclease SbcCD subunit D [Synechococcales bacterium]|nr:exonuclease SbcCD subunit D [Synechococcales bacterium]